jgi:hypothetical protein
MKSSRTRIDRLALIPWPARKPPRASAISSAEVERQRRFHQDAQHAERGAAQAERVLVAGRHLADAEEADQRVELVGQRTAQAMLPAGSASPAKRGR